MDKDIEQKVKDEAGGKYPTDIASHGQTYSYFWLTMEQRNAFLSGAEFRDSLDGWVKVEEHGLPDVGFTCLTYDGNYIGVLEFTRNAWRNETNEYILLESITHWRSLPKPPNK